MDRRRKVFFVVSAEQFERLKSLFDDVPKTLEEQQFELHQMGKLAGWDGLTLFSNFFYIHNTGRIRRDLVGGINTIAAIEAAGKKPHQTHDQGGAAGGGSGLLCHRFHRGL